MARPLRVEFPGAVYHVTSRGDRREPIFADDDDRHALIAIVAEAFGRFDASMLAYCLMGNHYHFVMRTRRANLSRVMRHINAIHAQAFNRRHGLVGHLFQGRFAAIHVDTTSYLLQVCRYTELNPVRARMVANVGDWPWSSYRAHVGTARAPSWLDTSVVHEALLGAAVASSADLARGRRLYEDFVVGGQGVDLWGEALRQEIFLGDEEFVRRIQSHQSAGGHQATEIPQVHRCQPRPHSSWLFEGPGRDESMRRAYVDGGMTMSEIGRRAGLSVSRVSRVIANAVTSAGSARAGLEAKGKT